MNTKTFLIITVALLSFSATLKAQGNHTITYEKYNDKTYVLRLSNESQWFTVYNKDAEDKVYIDPSFPRSFYPKLMKCYMKEIVRDIKALLPRKKIDYLNSLTASIIVRLTLDANSQLVCVSFKIGKEYFSTDDSNSSKITLGDLVKIETLMMKEEVIAIPISDELAATGYEHLIAPVWFRD